MLTVCCWFWEDKARKRSYTFTPDDVRIWDNMIARNLTVPHRRVCVTHRPDLFDFIETIPLEPDKHVPGLCTVKLQAHRPGSVAKEGDRVLSMDIDCVVTGNIDHLAQDFRDGTVFLDDCRWWKNPNFEVGGRRGFIQGSIQSFIVGATDFLWSDFDPRTTPAWLNRRFGGGEQAWISERMNASYPEPGWEWNVPHWTEKDGIYGAGRLFGGKPDNGVQTELPDNARIVFVPGDRKPGQPQVAQSHPWIGKFWR